MRRLYDLMMVVLIPLMILRLWLKSMKQKAYRYRIKERLACLQSIDVEHCIWVHAVSLGEVIAATPMVKQMRANHPDIPVLMTCMTPTGSQQITKTFGDEVVHVYVPFDQSVLVNRFLRKTKPRLAIIMETEIWPNLIHCSAKRGIPLVLANARLSEKSWRGYQKLSTLVNDLLSKFTLIGAQTTQDARRFQSLAPLSQQIKVMGNIKYDITIEPNLVAKAHAQRETYFGDKKIWIAGSTHRGEDEVVLQAHRDILDRHPAALLLIVPRHPERFDEVFALSQRMGFVTAKRQGLPKLNDNTQVLIANTMGELLLLYGMADVAFVGGSLIKQGGHNILEPAAMQVPCLTGPNMFNFAQIYRLFVENKALITVSSAPQLAESVAQCFVDETLCEAMKAQACQIIDANRGAMSAYLQVVNTLLNHGELDL